MFFSTYVLTKKGPLANIWLAAHWDKKLTRNEVRVINLNQTIIHIMQPAVPIALRTSGELLIGVVRIYSLKMKHLLKEATDVLGTLKGSDVTVTKIGKEGAVPGAAVTMDVVMHASENICEADFNDIADILRPHGALKTGVASGDKVVGSAWFAAEPSQFLEEQFPSQGDDELARVRADLMAFQAEKQRGDSNASKKSSLSSIEKGRASGLNPLENILEIGVPPPDDVEFEIPAGVEVPVADVEFEIPNVLEEVPTTAAKGKKFKVVNVLDTSETRLSKDEVDRWLRDTRETVNVEPRRGPCTAEEVHDRHAVRHAEANVLSMVPLGPIRNSALRTVFEACVKAAVLKAAADLEAIRNSELRPSNGHAALIHPVEDVPLPEEDPYNHVPLPDEDLFQVPNEEVGAPRTSRKRGRRGEGEDQDETRLSSSALATLEHLRSLLLHGKASSTTFAAATKKDVRLKAARAFVDLLTLTSHGIVDMRQAKPFGTIEIHKTALFSQPVVSH